MRSTRLNGLQALAVCLAAAAALAACSAEPTATPAPTATLVPVPTATPLPAPTATLEPTATPASVPAPAPQPTPTSTVDADAGIPSETLVMLADPLDEPEFYCVDVAGFGASLGLDRPLQAHTCKPGADDEMFAFNRPADGQVYLVEHDRCVEADGTSLYVRPCSDSQMQRFTYGDDRTLRLADGGVCLAVAGGDGEPAGGRSHLRRDLLLRPCSDVQPALSQWLFPGPSPNA